MFYIPLIAKTTPRPGFDSPSVKAIRELDHRTRALTAMLGITKSCKSDAISAITFFQHIANFRKVYYNFLRSSK